MTIRKDILLNNEVILGILLFTLIVNLIYALIKLRKDKSNRLSRKIVISNFFKRVFCGVWDIISFID